MAFLITGDSFSPDRGLCARVRLNSGSGPVPVLLFFKNINFIVFWGGRPHVGHSLGYNSCEMPSLIILVSILTIECQRSSLEVSVRSILVSVSLTSRNVRSQYRRTWDRKVVEGHAAEDRCVKIALISLKSKPCRSTQQRCVLGKENNTTMKSKLKMNVLD
jgi:hypothetical protein